MINTISKIFVYFNDTLVETVVYRLNGFRAEIKNSSTCLYDGNQAEGYTRWQELIAAKQDIAEAFPEYRIEVKYF